MTPHTLSPLLPSHTHTHTHTHPHTLVSSHAHVGLGLALVDLILNGIQLAGEGLKLLGEERRGGGRGGDNMGINTRMYTSLRIVYVAALIKAK